MTAGLKVKPSVVWREAGEVGEWAGKLGTY